MVLTLAEKAMQRIESLGRISDEPGCLTRTFLSAAMRRANDRVAEWMRDLNMTVRQDNIGNIIGRYPSPNPRAPVLLLGSHLDTVRNAGKFDGALGVIVALACLESLLESRRNFPFHIDLVGFSEEEGVRYKTPYLGSRVLAGTFDGKLLSLQDAGSIPMSDAIREFGGNPRALDKDRYGPGSLLAYCEAHIEQGPVLEARQLPIGLVTAIAGQTRAQIDFLGCAGHAGTSPMHLRRDALCGAAEFILQVESRARGQEGLVATVGAADIIPGVTNVIPAQARISLDVRHADDDIRRRACRELQQKASAIGRDRNLAVHWQAVSDNDSVRCSEALIRLLSEACRNVSIPAMPLASGAGHDAVSMAPATEIAMLFVRNRGGISHHPDESVALEDVAAAIAVMAEFIELLAQREQADA